MAVGTTFITVYLYVLQKAFFEVLRDTPEVIEKMIAKYVDSHSHAFPGTTIGYNSIFPRQLYDLFMYTRVCYYLLRYKGETKSQGESESKMQALVTSTMDIDSSLAFDSKTSGRLFSSDSEDSATIQLLKELRGSMNKLNSRMDRMEDSLSKIRIGA